MVPLRNVYNYILGRPFAGTLDTIAFLVHIKLKYHNVHKEIMTICDDLSRAQIIYKVLQRDKKRIEERR